jgi:hypothetical protein
MPCSSGEETFHVFNWEKDAPKKSKKIKPKASLLQIILF